MNRLSHYTNITALEKILKSNRFKFNSLKNMNDKLEGRSRDVRGLYNVIFCSSWCNDNSKSGIEYMWKNYTKEGEGIRINLPINPFREHEVKGFHISSEGCIPKSILPPEYYPIMIEGRFEGLENLVKINYTNDIEHCFPEINNNKYIQIYKLGKHKTKKWKIEKEWRYILYCMPRAIINYFPNTMEDFFDSFCIGCIYVDLKEDIFKQAEILASKNLTKENIEKLDELSSKYGFKVKYVF